MWTLDFVYKNKQTKTVNDYPHLAYWHVWVIITLIMFTVLPSWQAVYSASM